MTKTIRNALHKIEWPLLLAALLASALSFYLITEATGSASGRYLPVQAAAVALGTAAFVVMSLLDLNEIELSWRMFFCAEILLIAILIPFGVGMEQTGNKSWIRFTLAGFSLGFQPGELVRLLYIVGLAAHSCRLEIGRRAADLGAFVLHGLVPPLFLFYVSRDYGMTLSIISVFVVMLLLGGVKLRYFAGATVATGLLSPFIWNHLLLDRQRERLLIIFDPHADPLGAGYQTIRSVNAITAGGLSGAESRFFSALPARHTDFIFSVAGERLGFFGALLILALLLYFILRALFGALQAPNHMGRMVCAGVAGGLAFQVFANVGMCLGVGPVIGLTLPFFSYGGTSGVVCYMMIGLLTLYKKRRHA